MCTCPNYMIWTGNWTKNDRPDLKFVGHHQYNNVLEKFKEIPFIQVPCGKCLECRIQYTRQWSDRCVLEAKNSPYNYFLTLTYDDNHLPPRNSLDPVELQLFIKRLRSYFKRKLKWSHKIRYLASGEYGDASWRPHYHILLFNCPIPDLSYEFYREDENGKLIRTDMPPSDTHDLFFSKIIFDLWTDDEGHHKGMISLGRFNYDTAAYVAQYVTKKCRPEYDKGDIYKELNIYPEFLRMSTKPGIGAEYFHDHPQLHFEGKMVIPGEGQAHLSSIPRYYDKLFIQKYGETIFNSEVAVKRVIKRFNNRDTYTHSGRNFDRDNDMKDYKLKRIHHLKSKI